MGTVPNTQGQKIYSQQVNRTQNDGSVRQYTEYTTFKNGRFTKESNGFTGVFRGTETNLTTNAIGINLTKIQEIKGSIYKYISIVQKGVNYVPELLNGQSRTGVLAIKGSNTVSAIEDLMKQGTKKSQELLAFTQSLIKVLDVVENKYRAAENAAKTSAAYTDAVSNINNAGSKK